MEETRSFSWVSKGVYQPDAGPDVEKSSKKTAIKALSAKGDRTARRIGT